MTARRNHHALLMALCLCAVLQPAHGEIYQWVGEDGRPHFGDRPPSASAQTVTNLTDRYVIDRNFEVEIVPHDYAMQLDVRNKVSVAVAKIFSIYASDFVRRPDRNARLEIHIYDGEGTFRALTRERGLQVENASGFYSPKDNRIHVWKNRSVDRLLGVITHEASHAILQHQIGRAPPWVNEGLAEYFETMHVFGQTVVVHPNEYWFGLVKRRLEKGLLPLERYLSMTREAWYTFNGDDGLAYAMAWSLTWYLMSSESGIATIRSVFEALEREETPDAVALVAAGMSGDFERFETDWRDWALYGTRTPHRY